MQEQPFLPSPHHITPDAHLSHPPPHLCRAVDIRQFHLLKDLPSICCSAVSRALPVAREESVRILFFRLLFPLPAVLHRIQTSRSRLILMMLRSRSGRLSDRFPNGRELEYYCRCRILPVETTEAVGTNVALLEPGNNRLSCRIRVLNVQSRPHETRRKIFHFSTRIFQ